MKISPVQRYRIPKYPTLAAAQCDPALLSATPARWGASPGFTALVGLLTGLAARATADSDGAAGDRGPQAAVAQAPAEPRQAPAQAAAPGVVQQATAVVAPLLAEALQNDGRGAFGCVALNPPTFLSEEEALEIIRTELAAAGLKLDEDVELDNVASPVKVGWRAQFAGAEPATEEQAGAAPGEEKREAWQGRSARLAPQAFAFDLADAQHAVFIEYLSHRDYETWEVNRNTSSVWSYDFASLARRVTSAFRTRSADKRAIFGVFFDPLAKAEVERPNLSGLSAGQRRITESAYARALMDARQQLDDKAREKLRKQVRHFVAFLNTSGVVGKSP